MTEIVADRVKVSFSDGTSTTLYVLDDESITAKIAELCETEGWDSSEVTGYRIIGQVHEDDR
jgi:hypothetical protein